MPNMLITFINRGLQQACRAWWPHSSVKFSSEFVMPLKHYLATTFMYDLMIVEYLIVKQAKKENIYKLFLKHAAHLEEGMLAA